MFAAILRASLLRRAQEILGSSFLREMLSGRGSDCLLHFTNPTANITAALACSVTFFAVGGRYTRDQLSTVAVTSGAENSPLTVTFGT